MYPRGSSNFDFLLTQANNQLYGLSHGRLYTQNNLHLVKKILKTQFSSDTPFFNGTFFGGD